MTSSTCFVLSVLISIIYAQSFGLMVSSSKSSISSTANTLTRPCLFPTSISGTPTEYNVTVGASGTLRFAPNAVDADVGDLIRFSFLALNHTLTKSSLSDPCTSSDDFSTGFNQYNPLNVSGEFIVDYWVKTRDPQWFFCAQTDPASHCKSGMVFALNAGEEMQAFISAATETTTSSITSTLSHEIIGGLFSTTSFAGAATTVDVTTVLSSQATSSLQASTSEASHPTSTPDLVATGIKHGVTTATTSVLLCLLALLALL